MKTLNNFGAVLGVVGILTLGACGTGGPFGGTGGPFGGSSPAAAPAPAAINAGAAQPGTGVVQSIEPVQQDGKTIQRFTIRMDTSGARQTITNATNAGFVVGDRVRIESGKMSRN